MNELYPIGDVARRTGLSVSAIRYYADEGVVVPTEHADGGVRHYDVQAIARLEIVRTLRELGAGLADIRSVLAARMSLAELAATHLDLVERQLRQFGARRAVLRTILRLHTTTEQVSLMHKLVSTSDDDRDRLIDRFWTAITDGLDVHPGYVEQLHGMRPHLPDEPSPEQLEAWIELADAVQDPAYTQALRDFFHHAFSTDQGRLLATPEMLARVAERRELFLAAQAAQEAGVAADSPEARDIATRMAANTADFTAALTGQHDLDEARRRMVAFDPNGEAAQKLAMVEGFKLFRRYLSLVAAINGTPQPDPARAAVTQQWIAAALR